MTVTDVRNETSIPLHPALAERWSPRSLDVNHVLSAEEITALAEAARWAPSAANTQPTHFILGRRGTDTFVKIVESLAGFNQVWAPRASALLVALAETTRDGRPVRWAEYDLGQAVAHLSIEATSRGLVVHQMGGFDVDQIRSVFEIDHNLTPVTVVAVGRYDRDGDIDEQIRERDRAPRTRRDLDDLTLILDV